MKGGFNKSPFKSPSQTFSLSLFFPWKLYIYIIYPVQEQKDIKELKKMAQFSLNQNFDIGLVPNDWNATPVSTSIENLYTFDVHVEERFQINEKIGQNLIEENEELKQRVLYLETQLDILLKRFNRLVGLYPLINEPY